MSRASRTARWAWLLVALGLLIEAVSLLWAHPTAFVLFLVPGALLVVLGVLLYLLGLATRSAAAGEPSEAG